MFAVVYIYTHTFRGSRIMSDGKLLRTSLFGAVAATVDGTRASYDPTVQYNGPSLSLDMLEGVRTYFDHPLWHTLVTMTSKYQCLKYLKSFTTRIADWFPSMWNNMLLNYRSSILGAGGTEKGFWGLHFDGSKAISGSGCRNAALVRRYRRHWWCARQEGESVGSTGGRETDEKGTGK